MNKDCIRSSNWTVVVVLSLVVFWSNTTAAVTFPGTESSDVAVEGYGGSSEVLDLTRDPTGPEHGEAEGSSDFFSPLLADPRESSSHVSLVKVDSGDTGLNSFNAAFIGVAVSYPLHLDRSESNSSDGLALNIESAVLSQFNIDAASDDLLNTDYFVGFPLTYRSGTFSFRFRLMHQSSHLGDEFLLSGQAPRRVNLSVEYVDLILSQRFGPLRLYGGGAYAFRRSPQYLDPGEVQTGLEYRAQPLDYLPARPILALNYRTHETTDWSPEVSARLGLYFSRIGETRTKLHLMLEAYEGAAPFGQFFNREIKYYGLGFYFDI